MSDPKREHANSTDANRDPITGEPGAHPVGVGVGTAVGGAAAGIAGGAAAGAAGGTVAGPVGVVVGAVAGGIVGGLAGKSIAESIDPTAEDAYWRDNYSTRPYHDPSVGYEEIAPAYRYGWESRARHSDRTFDEAEPELKRDWDSVKANSRLHWDRAKVATRDAWDRVERSVTGRQTDK